MGITHVDIELPSKLAAEAQVFVEEGFAGSLNELIAHALHRHLESHSPLLQEIFMREDVEWGLMLEDSDTPHKPISG